MNYFKSKIPAALLLSMAAALPAAAAETAANARAAQAESAAETQIKPAAEAQNGQAQAADAAAQAEIPAALPPIKKNGNVYSFTFANGLQAVVLPNHRAPVVTNMVWYRVGSADEPQGRTGIAHFLEHLMFKGTKNYPAGEFSGLISRIGGEENAFTSYDYTGYYQTVAPQYLPDMMAREADRMENLILTDDVIGPERQVIIEERRMRTDNTPSAMLEEEARATLFLNSPYHNPVIGWKQEMEQLNRRDALDFYGRFYAPSNAIVIIAGDIEPEAARQMAARTYGAVKSRGAAQPRIRPQEPESRTLREVTMRDGRVSEPSFQLYRIAPSYHNAKNPREAAALDLLGEILGGGNQSRLYQSLVVKKGIAASVGSAYDGRALDDGVFYIYGLPRGGANLAQLEQAVNAEIEAVIKNGVSADELEAARKRYIKSFIFSQDSPSGLAEVYGEALTTGMSIDDVANWPERLQAVKPADIKAAAARWLAPGLGTVSRLLPPGKAEKDGAAAETGKAAAKPAGKAAAKPAGKAAR